MNCHFLSPLRYPGGKAFLAPEFKDIIEQAGLRKPIYVEPYTGGAGAALTLLFLGKVSSIVINDLDYNIYAFWKSVKDYPYKFSRKILSTPVTISEWKKQKLIFNNKKASLFSRGFATFFLNRTNVSGVLNAWPIGGIEQRGNYKITARYNKRALAARVRRIGEYKKCITVLNDDGINIAKKYLKKKNVFIYLDPPYFKKGMMLYLNHYEEQDHHNLANLLNTHAKKNWILTYDELNKTRDLYPFRFRRRLNLKYRVRKSRNARELMIFSDTLSPSGHNLK